MILKGECSGLLGTVEEVLQAKNVLVKTKDNNVLLEEPITHVTPHVQIGSYVGVRSGVCAGRRGVVMGTENGNIVMHDEDNDMNMVSGYKRKKQSLSNTQIKVPGFFIERQDRHAFTGTGETVKSAAPINPGHKAAPGDTDVLALRLCGRQVYIVKGHWKGRRGMATSIDGERARVQISGGISGCTIDTIRRTHLITYGIHNLTEHEDNKKPQDLRWKVNVTQDRRNSSGRVVVEKGGSDENSQARQGRGEKTTTNARRYSDSC